MRFEILPKMKIFANFANIDMQKCQDVSPSIGHINMYYSSLDLPRQDASNGGLFMSLKSLDRKLFVFYCFEYFGNNTISIDSRNMKMPPFDASRYGESNKLQYVNI